MTRQFERFSSLAGVLAVVLWAASLAIVGGDHIGIPGGLPEEGADDTHAFFRENESRVTGANLLFMLGSLFFLWFVAVLRTRLGDDDDRATTFRQIAFAGGLATAIFAIVMPSGGLVAALNAKDIAASTAEALNAFETAFFIAAELSAVVLLVGGALEALRRGRLPRWWAIVSILLAVWLLIVPIGWAGLLLGVPAWTLVTSVLLFRGPRHERDRRDAAVAAP